MFFKNARLYRLTRPMEITPDQLEAKLAADPFKPCGPQESWRSGWVSPFGERGQVLAHAANRCLLICLKREERVLPAACVREAVQEQVEAIEAEQMRKVARKEKEEIKEQLIQEMLPRAFTKSKRTFAYIDLDEQMMVIDAASDQQAEMLATTLRKSLGSLPIRPIALEQAPAFTFSGWISETVDLHAGFSLGSACELKDLGEEGGLVRIKNLDLQGDEVRNHLNAGMQATKLALDWEGSVTFTLEEDLTLRGLKFGDVFQEKLDDIDADDAAAKFNAAFTLMTLELRRLVPALVVAVGGEDLSAISDKPVQFNDSAATETVSDPDPQKVAMASYALTASSGNSDPLFSEAVEFVRNGGRASFPSLQRHFKIGYNRACNLVDAMEGAGVVSKPADDGRREVIPA